METGDFEKANAVMIECVDLMIQVKEQLEEAQRARRKQMEKAGEVVLNDDYLIF